MNGFLLDIAIQKSRGMSLELLRSAEITLEQGVKGDWRGRPGARQVTVLGREGWEAACAAVGADLDWTLRRANILEEGLDLRQTLGKRLHIGSAVLEITDETMPCKLMDRQYPGLRQALETDWRGGVCCRVLIPGAVRVGDPAWVEETPESSG